MVYESFVACNGGSDFTIEHKQYKFNDKRHIRVLVGEDRESIIGGEKDSRQLSSKPHLKTTKTIKEVYSNWQTYDNKVYQDAEANKMDILQNVL